MKMKQRSVRESVLYYKNISHLLLEVTLVFNDVIMFLSDRLTAIFILSIRETLRTRLIMSVALENSCGKRSTESLRQKAITMIR